MKSPLDEKKVPFKMDLNCKDHEMARTKNVLYEQHRMFLNFKNLPPSIKLCNSLISAFKHAVQQVDGFSSETDMFNSDFCNNVMKLCFIELVPALIQILNITPEGHKKEIDPSKSKLWKQTQTMIESYLIDLLKLFDIIKDSTVLVPLLKHTIHLIPFYTQFMKLSRHLLKRVISLWCRNEETVRVLSLIIIVRTTKALALPKDYLGQVLINMYFSYVKNTKFTSPTSWPMISIMKCTLTEVYTISPEIAYEHAFIYVRQLAICLQNAQTTKKENFQTVYNWQYVHCLQFWTLLLCRLHQDPLKTLISPLVQTIIGTINLIPTARYIPLRFHLVKSLMQISKDTGNFIPTLPFILDVLRLIDYNEKSPFSDNSINFMFTLKVTQSQLLEAGFKEKCIGEVCELLSDYLKIYSHTVGFPELALPAILQIKAFMKQCKVPKYNQQLKAVLGKIEENVSFISEKKHSASFEIMSVEEIKKWEQNILELKTPLLKFEKPVVIKSELSP